MNCIVWNVSFGLLITTITTTLAPSALLLCCIVWIDYSGSLHKQHVVAWVLNIRVVKWQVGCVIVIHSYLSSFIVNHCQAAPQQQQTCFGELLAVLVGDAVDPLCIMRCLCRCSIYVLNIRSRLVALCAAIGEPMAARSACSAFSYSSPTTTVVAQHVRMFRCRIVSTCNSKHPQVLSPPSLLHSRLCLPLPRRAPLQQATSASHSDARLGPAWEPRAGGVGQARPCSQPPSARTHGCVRHA